MNAVLGQAIVAPKALDEVVANLPAPGLVRVHAAGVAVADVGAPGVGQFDVGASHHAVVGKVRARAVGVDLDGLFGGVNDVDVVDEGARGVCAGGGVASADGTRLRASRVWL